MKLLEAAKNIATFGYYAQQRTNKLELELKSLRDASMTGQAFGSAGGVVSLVPSTNQGQVFKKINVELLRSYAEYSVWVRAGIDIYRDTISRATAILEPVDPKRPMDPVVQQDLENLFSYPNDRGDSYKRLKAGMIEDYLVLGHGALERQNRYNGTPIALYPVNGQLFGFVKEWDGDSRSIRYVETDFSGSVEREFTDADVAVMINRPRTYDELGLSHVEILDRAIRSLLDGDDFLYEQVLNGAPSGALFLGQGLTRQQAEDTAQQIKAVKRAFAIVGGAGTSAKYVPFQANPEQMKILDTQTWFVRQVAAIFRLPTSMFQLEADQSRANTESMLNNANDGLGGLLSDSEDMENTQIVNAYGEPKEHNVRRRYPILNSRDETAQAEISSRRLGNTAYSSINEERRSNGLDPLDNPLADEVLISTGQGPVPLSVLAAGISAQQNNKLMGVPSNSNLLPPGSKQRSYPRRNLTNR